jgi:hypothetical protein
VSVAGTAIPGQVFTSTEVPTISGDVVVGETLTADPGVWDPVPDSFTYVWKRGTSVIEGEVSATYILTGDDVGLRITAIATAVKTGYNTTSTTSAQTASVVDVLAETPTPTISGTAAVGELLTADAGIWLPAPVALTYSWSRDSSVIGGAVGSTYRLVVADLGALITVTVTGTKAGFATVSTLSVATDTVAEGTFSSAPAPTITGFAAKGEILTAQTSGWTPLASSVGYQWMRDTVAIDVAIESTYTLTADDLGTVITVTITGARAGYTTVVVASVGTDAVLDVFSSGTVSITGDPLVGTALVADPGSWTPADGLVSYQWFRGGDPITDAVAASYTLVEADLGTTVSVTVTVSKTGYRTAEASASLAIPAV